MDATIWERSAARGLAIDLPAAARHYPCRSCRRGDQVLIVPTRRPPRIGDPTANLIAGYVHRLRSSAKSVRRR